MPAVLHVSDLHFGRFSLPAQVRAIEELIATDEFDVVAVSGDLTQRARVPEFARAREFLDRAEQAARTLVVPGNHDVTWWRAPFHLAPQGWMYAKWRKHMRREVEPVLRVPGVVVVGLNTAHGISRYTLTRRPRDLSVIGDLRDGQLARVRRELDRTPPGVWRVVVMHHNPVAGEISGRYGLKHSTHVLNAFAEMGVDAVLCGHDHQEAVHHVEHTRRGVVVSIAGTITTRSRGGRPCSVNVLNFGESGITVRTLVWERRRRAFTPGAVRTFGGTPG